MTNLGHYGKPALILAAAGVFALVVHLAVPWGVYDCGGDFCPEDETIWRSDVADGYSGHGAASPTTTLTGAIMTVAAGLMLLVFGFVSMPTSAARAVGWLFGALGVVGATMVSISSAMVTGDAFANFLTFIFSDADTTVWLISPPFVLIGGVAALWYAFGTMVSVTPVKDGGRDQAARTARGARLALSMVVLMFLVPWAINLQDDATGDSQASFTSLHSAMELADASSGGGPFGQEMFSGLGYSGNVFIALAWIAVGVAALALAGPIMAEALRSRQVASVFSWLPTVNVITAVWGTVLYILMWSYMWDPNRDIDGNGTWMPGIFPIVVAPLMFMWVMSVWHDLVQASRGVKQLSTTTQRANFD